MSANTEVPEYSPRNFVEHLRMLAASRPDDIALVVVDECNGIPVDRPFTYAQLDMHIRALAALLQTKTGKGDRVLLLLSNNEHYAVAFFACLYAGLIAVPAFPPESMREQHLARLSEIARDAEASCILTTRDALGLAGELLRTQNNAVILAVDETDDVLANTWVSHVPDDEDIAFLQYTSGSTSAPKGVMVTLGNLMANERAIGQALSITENDVIVSWLPLFHDMGLIGGLLQPFYRGIRLVLMSPEFFLQKPLRWLEAIARHKGTVSGGPDFSYRLCLERVKEKQIAGLDLSSWRIAFSGAEPVRPDTLMHFTTRFQAAHFRATAVCPCYGLAEATLMVSAGEPGAGMMARAFHDAGLQSSEVVPDTAGKTLVACGKVVSRHRVEIRDMRDRTVCPDTKVGEIWVSGPSVAQGYWRKPEATAETFVEQGHRLWLRTGDLGFMYEGELYIAGRLKDLIIVRGHNLYPQDIEQIIETELDAVRKGRVAAFAVDGANGEGIGVAVEVSRSVQKSVPASKLVGALSETVSGICGEPLSVVLLLNPGGLPKTSSGKLQRNACRQGWLNKNLDVYAIFEHGQFVLGDGGDNESGGECDALEIALRDIWAAVLNRKNLDRNTHFFAAGGNSLDATQISAAIQAHWGITFPVSALFENPRLSECAAEIRRRLGLGASATFENIPVLSSEQRQRPQPLSPAQQRQWFLWLLDPENTAYHIQGALRLSGYLDRQVLVQTLLGLAQRHESLRTLLEVGPDGEVTQRVQPHGQLPVQLFHLENQSDAENQAADILRRCGAESFDLICGPLVRALLICLPENQYILAIIMHHIISDGVSMQILVDELAVCYEASLRGETARLDKLPVQYVDYSLWLQHWLSDGRGERQQSYWRERLGDEHTVLPLQVDHSRQVVARYGAAQYDFDLPERLSTGLRQLAASVEVTLFMALLTGLHILLHRYTGQRHIRIGVPVANRPSLEARGVIGLFVNTLVLDCDLKNRAAPVQLLKQVRDMALAAQANQDLPFEQLVALLQPERSLAHNPLFQVMFNHLSEDYRILRGLPGLAVTREPFPPRDAQFELTLDTREDGQGRVRCCFTYAKELFERETIERMAGHYLRVLDALVERPQYPVEDIELLSPAERRMLEEWGIDDRHLSGGGLVHQLFQQQAALRPEAIALSCCEQQLSYGELNRRANRLAHHLLGLGIKPETRVGIATDRSIEMVVGLLAILKAGAAYVPLDPEYPQERLSYMIEDSRIEWLLMQRHLRERLNCRETIKRIGLDENLISSPESALDPELPINAENLAYVIYTSGSTGRPKGVMVRQAALTNFMQSMREQPGVTKRDTLVAVTSLSFDIAALEIFLPLVCGARVVLAARETARDGAALARLIDQHQATLLQSTPAGWRILRETGWTPGRPFKGLCGGEALPPDLADDLPAAGIDLWNMYGPTETTIWSTAVAVSASQGANLGRAIAATRMHVLDGALNPVAIGVAGELYLGGAGLARGYLQRPDLTVERFIADPQGAAGARLYRTGDLVRWDVNGRLEYLGRLDHQVKIRGFRIELGEVEAALLAQPEIREAVVVAKEGPAGTRLVGYVSGRAGNFINTAWLCERLGQSLPDYMVPAAIVVLENLPLNANGKVDRKALPEPDATSIREYEAPQGEVEKILARIWTEVLGVERVGRRDNFFELGGHSLIAIMLVSRVRIALGAELPLRRIFEFPSLQAMAACIQGVSDDRQAVQVPLSPVARKPSMPLSPAQQRLWLVERMSGLSGSQKSAAYNMAAALRLSGELNSAHLQKTLDTILARHEVLRTVYLEDDDGDPIAVVCEPTGLYMPVTDFTHMPVNERQSVVDRILAEFSAQPFELSSCPLVRSQLLRFDPTQHVLLLCIHHIAFDGWSVAVFVREFAAIYEGLNTGVAPLIPALDIQYTDYAVWQHQWLAATSEKNKEFWCRYLDGAPAATTVTADYAKSSKISTAGDALRMKIPGNAVTAINLLARRHETSAFTFLLATFTALLHRWTGASDMVIGTDVAGRSHPALENLIGFFVNVVPLRSRLTAGMTFSQWLRQTKETSLAAFEHQDVPLDQIVDYAKVQRNRGGNPLVQVLFVMQNTPRAHFDIPGLHIEVLPAPVATSKFDIAVFVEENEDGFHVDWIYATSLYQRETMEKMLNMWNELLQQVVATPEAPLEGINTSTITPSPDPLSSLPVAAKAGKLDKLKNIAGRPVASTAVNRSPIRTSFFASDRQFPLVVEAASADQDAVAWARAQRGFIEESLGQYAAVLFRNFGLKTPQDFEAFAEAIEPELHGSYGDLPKKEGGRNIYQSTPYPERQMILYHNESSHLERWPRKQWFFCEVPSRIGGATPIVDCREMLRRLPQDIVRRFEEKGLLYVRTFTPRLDVSWQDFYKTEDTAELEIRLAAAGMTWRWLDKETLQVRSHSPAVITHPLTGDRVFFNQIQLHHPHCLESGMRTDLLDLVGAERMPRQVYYGDGSPIDDETVAVIGHCYEQCTVRFSWQQGDVALLDNMLVAHARDPYQGERKIVVAMGAMFERTALNSTPW